MLCICSKAKTRGPRAEQRFRWARRPAHTRRGYRCYIYGMQTRGADRAGADVEYRVGGGVSCVEVRVTNVGGVAWGHPVRSGDAQRLNGQGPGPDEKMLEGVLVCEKPIIVERAERTDGGLGLRRVWRWCAQLGH